MTIPVFRRFTQGDIPNAPNWVGNITGPLNVFCEQTVQAFTKNLTIGQNVQGQIFATSFTTPAGYAGGTFTPITVSYTGGGRPTCCLIGQLDRDDGTAILTATAITSWTLNINSSPAQIQINYVAGLVASKKYNLTFIVL
tara:strand:+ start:116 stop:535 length:420 start_codon:yes stop_codon:yes gene_type:complete